jgi:hypothetical protein
MPQSRCKGETRKKLLIRLLDNQLRKAIYQLNPLQPADPTTNYGQLMQRLDIQFLS